MAVFLVAGTTARAEPKLVAEGKVTFGVNATFAPFEFQEGEKLVGLDMDLAEELGRRLQLEPVAMNMEFQGLIPALLGGRIDIVNSAMYINPERSAQVDFVPYLRLGNELVVEKGNPKGITGRDEDLCGKVVAVTLGNIQGSCAPTTSGVRR